MTSRESDSTDRKWDWESLLVPVVLMVTGTLLLAGADIGVVSLDRMQNMWPAAIVMVGLAELFSGRPPECDRRDWGRRD